MRKPFVLLSFLFCSAQQAFSSKDTLSMSFESEHFKIHGRIIAPKDRSKKMPAVIFIVGSGGNSSYLTNYADFINFFLEQPLASENIALVYFDKRGVGESEGKWYKTDFEKRALDAKNAAECLKTFSFIDTQQIYLVGHSQGGWIVQVCLANYPDTFAGGISMAGATFGVKKQLINDYQSAIICSKKFEASKALRKAKSRVNKIVVFTSLFPFKKDWRQLNRIKRFEISPYLPKIKKPILFLWGENDTLVSPQWCLEELHSIFPNGTPKNMETFTAKGESHSFKATPFCYNGKTKDLPYSSESRRMMIDWLLSRTSMQK